MEAQGRAQLKETFLPLLQLKPRSDENQWPKPSNVERLLRNSVKRKLPSALAHLYPLTKAQYMWDVHPSWFRTFLRSDEVRKEFGKQRDTNIRVHTDIQQLKRDVSQIKTQLKIKEYVEQSVKNDADEEADIAMFPDN